jgi:outer membrane protein assembly factor BamB
MTTTALPCPKCHAVVHLRTGETKVQCTGCGADVTSADAASSMEPAKPVSKEAKATGTARTNAEMGSNGGERARQTVLSASLVVLAAGFLALAVGRRLGVGHKAPPPPEPTPIYTAPPIVPVVPTPEGEVAWEANARGPVVATVNGDSVEDIIGFFRVWDGRSAWIAYAGAFDGATLKPLWRSEPIDPQIVKQAGVTPQALVLGSQVIVADTSETLRVFSLPTGEKQFTLKLSGAIIDVCGTADQPGRIWVHVVDGGDTMIDLASQKAALAPRPKWCPVPALENTNLPPLPPIPTAKDLAAVARKKADLAACTRTFLNGLMARATCRAPDSAKLEDGFIPAYVLSDGTVTIDFGTKGDLPFAEATTKTTDASPWAHGFITDDTKAKPLAPVIVDLTGGRVYAVYEKVYFDARIAALDARTGRALWDVPLVGSLPGSEGPGRGEARALVATASRVYVVRAGGGLDIFNASSGKPLGTIGKD